MKLRYYLFPFVALAEHYEEDLVRDNKLPADYIPETIKRWGVKVVKFAPFKVGCDFSYFLETDEYNMIINLGTHNGAGWRSNIFGWFLSWKGMHSGFGKAGYKTFKVMKSTLIEALSNHKPFVQGQHSRGVRGEALALLVKERLGQVIWTVSYCPPDMWTKKGRDRFMLSGLCPYTENLISRGDLVDNTGLGRYGSVVTPIELPEVKGYDAGTIGFVSGHRYSAVAKALEKDARNNGLVEASEWLRKTLYICVN